MITTISKLRSNPEAILKKITDRPIIFHRRNKPVAAILGYRQYERFNKLLDLAEENMLGMVALERDKKPGKKDFADIEDW